MKFSEFSHMVRKILNVDLPTAASVLKESRLIAGNINIGRTTFMSEMGVGSELEYKTRCIKDNRIMFHAHIGLNSWQSTADALAYLNRAVRESGHVVDRAGICLDRRMGLPKAHRANVPSETGPMLESDQDWREIGQAAPIQPHMGDFMIGFPAGVENTIHALKAGVTTIGNLSQFFAHEVPMWQDTIATTVATAKAIAIMGTLRDRGTLVHSYLEDGFAALFCDCTTAAGWACLEKYIVEDLLGARLAHCIGGLTTDPLKRAGWVFALNKIHANDCVGSMVYGDTLSFSPDFSENRGLVAEYLMWDIMAQLKCPTGHAVLPLPVTEALRVPSAAEIAEAQILGRRVEQTARRLLPYMDFSAAEAFSETVWQAGKSVFENCMAGLKEAGVDLRDPIQLLYVLKKLGPAVFEEMFGAGDSNPNYARGRMPVIATDVFELSNRHADRYRPVFTSAESKHLLKDRRILIASTDVHEHAVMIIHMLLAEAGAEPIYLGAEADPDKVASAACAAGAEAILISTHNGMALEYARRLNCELDKHEAKIPVVMGGVLNQKVADQPLPIDASADLTKLGYIACPALEGRFLKLLEFGMSPQDFNK
jgi:methylmalonyl-CoA mutase cobalamin-binding subunit